MRRHSLVGLIALLASGMAVHTLGQGGSTQKAPTGDDIVQACGSRLAKMFARFGYPENVTPLRRSKPELDRVLLTYGKFAFESRDRTVQACLFYSDYTETVRGIKIGEPRQQVEKVLGTEHKVEKGSQSDQDLGYAMKNLDATFWVDFDKDDKVRMIEVQLN